MSFKEADPSLITSYAIDSDMPKFIVVGKNGIVEYCGKPIYEEENLQKKVKILL